MQIFQSNEIVTEKQTCQKLMKENTATLTKVQEIEGKILIYNFFITVQLRC